MKENMLLQKDSWEPLFKIYKYMTLVSKNIYIDKLDDIANKYDTYHSTVKMEPIGVKSNIY